LGDIATTKGIETTSPDAQLCDARASMAQRRIRRLPVVKDGRLVGMLSLGDVALGSASMRSVGESLAAISTSAATQETNPGPDIGTPERVKLTREAS
jgi:signal-transduction protein with cAMP-binding, CBS, and nucleotidyltransferase domain